MGCAASLGVPAAAEHGAAAAAAKTNAAPSLPPTPKASSLKTGSSFAEGSLCSSGSGKTVAFAEPPPGLRSPSKTNAKAAVAKRKGSSAREKVALVGSGNWGSAIATKIGLNVLANDIFDKEVQMWVFEEYVKLEDGKWIRPARGAQPPEGKTWVDEDYEPLTVVINRLNENVIYLPGIKLPKSIIAQPDIKKCVTGATMMVFVIPHNFLAPIVPKMEARAPAAPYTHLLHLCPRPVGVVLKSCAGALCAGRLRPGRRGHLADQGHRVQRLEAHPHLRPARSRDEEGTPPYHATPLTMPHPSPCNATPLTTLHPSPRYTPHHATPPYHYSLAISLTYPRAHRHARPHPHLDPHKGANAPDVDMSVLMGANVANEVAKLQPVY